MGKQPDEIDPDEIRRLMEGIHKSVLLTLFAQQTVPFDAGDVVFQKDALLPGHSNGMRFTAFGVDGQALDTRVFYSVGGGFITEEGEAPAARIESHVLYPFGSADELLRIGEDPGLPIHLIMLTNEMTWRPIEKIRDGVQKNLESHAGLHRERARNPRGTARRTRSATSRRRHGRESTESKPKRPSCWRGLAERLGDCRERGNAAGGRVVTVPTNGAAGIVPAVAHYYLRFLEGNDEGILRYFLGAAVVGVLYKENASISGAEVGCQGEVSVACSMAAGGLVSALAGTNEQLEHAAEIAMEHNLGMTGDSVGGLVQIPCIERNAFGAVKAVNAARMAMKETTGHKVSLDQVIRTMYQTGLDMQTRYEETALGGLALNVIEC
jgi:L-serine dehydratase